jgi:anti-anti-sigma factor
MAFDATLTISNDIGSITLVGELDASTASFFQEKVKEAATYDLKKLVLRMEELEYMASAGLRVLIFSKQQMGTGVTIFVVGPQEMVQDTLEKTGFHHSVVMLEQYDPEQIANY